MANGQPTVESLTDPFILTFTTPPVIGPGVCDICHGSPSPGWDRCYSCAQTVGQVSRPVELVVPITLCEAMGQMHHVLRSYKDSPDDGVRTRMRLRIAALLYRFLATHRNCIINSAGRDWSVITTVPSSTGRAGTHPLELVIQHVPPVEQEHATLLRRGAGQLGHNRASDDGYEVTEDVAGMAVLLVDDTFTAELGGKVPRPRSSSLAPMSSRWCRSAGTSGPTSARRRRRSGTSREPRASTSRRAVSTRASHDGGRAGAGDARRRARNRPDFDGQSDKPVSKMCPSRPSRCQF